MESEFMPHDIPVSTFKEIPIFVHTLWGSHALALYPDLVKLIDWGRLKVAYNYESMAFELFARFVLYNPSDIKNFGVERSDEPLKPEHQWIGVVHDCLLSNLDFKLLLGSANRASLDGCALATLSILSQLKNEVPPPSEPMLRDPEALRTAYRSGKERGLLGIDLSSIYEEGKAVSGALSEYADSIKYLPQDTISKICRKAYEDFSRLLEPLKDMGVASESLGIPATDFSAKKKIADQLSKSRKLEEILRMVGKLLPRAKEVRDRKDASKGFIRDTLDSGDDISQLASSELESFVTDKADFLTRWDDRKLTEFAPSEVDRHSGAIVVLLDSTGSMAGQTELWAKAVLWAIAMIAFKDKRSVCVVHYGDGARLTHEFDPNAKGGVDLEQWLETIEYFYGDSVNNERPAFDTALDIIKKGGKFAGADIVFLHDGGYEDGGSTDKGWIKKFDKQCTEYSVKVHTVLINCGRGAVPDEFLRHATYVGDLANESVLDSLFEEF